MDRVPGASGLTPGLSPRDPGASLGSSGSGPRPPHPEVLPVLLLPPRGFERQWETLQGYLVPGTGLMFVAFLLRAEALPMSPVASLAEFGGEAGQGPHTRADSSLEGALTLLPQGQGMDLDKPPSLHSKWGTLRSGT